MEENNNQQPLNQEVPTPVMPVEPTPVVPTEPTPVVPTEPTPVVPETPVMPTEPVAPVNPVMSEPVVNSEVVSPMPTVSEQNAQAVQNEPATIVLDVPETPAQPNLTTPSPNMNGGITMPEQTISTTPVAPVASPTVEPAPVTPTPVTEQPQPAAAAPATEAPKKSNKVLIIVIAVLAVVLIGLVLWKFVFSVDNKDVPATPDAPTKPVEPETPSQPVASANTVTIDDYEYQLADGYELYEYNGQKAIINKADKTLTMFKVYRNTKYSLFVSSTDSLKTEFANGGFTINDSGEKTLGGKQWLFFDLSVSQSQLLTAVTSINDRDSIQLAVYKYGTKSNDEILTSLAPIVSSVKYVGTSNFADEPEETEVKDFKVETVNVEESIFE